MLVIPNVTETFHYPRRVRHSENGRQTRLHLVFKRDEDLTKPLHGDVLYCFSSCLRRDGNSKSMKYLFVVQTVFKTISKI